MSIQKHGHVWDLLGDTILNYSTEHLVTVQLSREITQPSALLGRGGRVGMMSHLWGQSCRLNQRGECCSLDISVRTYTTASA